MDLLKSLNACDIFLKWCLNLVPTISSAHQFKYDGELVLQQKSLHLPQSQGDIQSIRQNLKQIDVNTQNILRVLQLPIMEPSSEEKIKQLTNLSMSALYCCSFISVAQNIGTANSNAGSQVVASKNASTTTTSVINLKEGNNANTTEVDPYEEISRNVVNQALEIFKNVHELLRKYSRSNIYQNHICMGGWLLLAGIHGTMSVSSGSLKSSVQLQAATSSSTPDELIKGKSPSRHSEGSNANAMHRVNLFKVQQGFGILNIMIAKYGIKLLEELLDQLKTDYNNGIDFKLSDDVLITQQQQMSTELQNFNILKEYSSIDRVVCVFNGYTIQQLMTFLATISYRKACSLKHMTEFGSEQLSYSDSTTYFNDTLSCSEEDSDTEEGGAADDSDEESSDGYLGTWLKEALSPEGNDGANIQNDKQDENQKNNTQF
jgi:E3 ubiquitin-protein ligase UBR4